MSTGSDETADDFQVDDIPQCFNCKNFDTTVEGDMRCTAFPDGIPMQIRLNEHDHRDAFRGDGGIRFESIE